MGERNHFLTVDSIDDRLDALETLIPELVEKEEACFNKRRNAGSFERAEHWRLEAAKCYTARRELLQEQRDLKQRRADIIENRKHKRMIQSLHGQGSNITMYGGPEPLTGEALEAYDREKKQRQAEQFNTMYGLTSVCTRRADIEL